MDFILSEKRKDVLVMIDRLGVVTGHQLEKFLSYMGVNTVRRARHQLKEIGFVEEKRFGRRKVVAITKKGSEYVGNIMTGASSSYSNLQHDLTVNEIILNLVYQYRNKGHSVIFHTEREVVREAFLSLSYEEINKPNKLRHLSKEVPDFLLKVDDKKFAFEVELSRKTNTRLERKMKYFKQSIEEGLYTNVFYICKDEAIKKHVDLFAKGANLDIRFLQLHDLVEEG